MDQYQCPNCLEIYYRITEDRIKVIDQPHYADYWNKRIGMWAFYDEFTSWSTNEGGKCCWIELPL